MKNTFSATKLVEKSNQEERLDESLIPGWLLRLGGATLLVGGLGYLWYRNSELGQFRRFTDEDFYQLNFRIENRVFLEKYLIARKTFNQLTIEEKLRDPRIVIDFSDPQTQENFVQISKKPLLEDVLPLIRAEIKNSKHPNLKLTVFQRKLAAINLGIDKKFYQGIEPTHTENKFMNVHYISFFLGLGLLGKAFTRDKIGGQADGLDHKECLQLLVDYESQTIRELLDLYKRMVLQGQSRDFQQRIEAYDQLFDRRLRMEELVAYTVEKLGAAYADLPEEEKYHPLILFLSKAHTVPPNLGYSFGDVTQFLRFCFYDINSMIRACLKKMSSPISIEVISASPIDLLKAPVAERFLKNSGLKFDLYEKLA